MCLSVTPPPQENADLVTFTEEILNGKLRFPCSELYSGILEVEFCPNYLRSINICGSCTGDNCQGASCPRWELSGGNCSVGNYFGANCTRGNYPGDLFCYQFNLLHF